MEHNAQGGVENSQQCYMYFLQYSTFASKRTQGLQTCFLPWAPSNIRHVPGAIDAHDRNTRFFTSVPKKNDPWPLPPSSEQVYRMMVVICDKHHTQQPTGCVHHSKPMSVSYSTTATIKCRPLSKPRDFNA